MFLIHKSRILYILSCKLWSVEVYLKPIWSDFAKMIIRKAVIGELDTLMSLFEKAKGIMRASGNTRQWGCSYPSAEVVAKDILSQVCYVACDDVTGEIIATMALIPGPDPTYSRIYDGSWPDDGSYYVIHRIAAAEPGRGVAVKMLDFAFSLSPVIRVDTHRDNCIMHHLLCKYGFSFCGVIHLANGDPRDAYSMTKRLF